LASNRLASSDDRQGAAGLRAGLPLPRKQQAEVVEFVEAFVEKKAAV